MNIIIARVDSWLEHWTLACGNTIFENQEEERCNEEEHEVEGNYPILGENTEKESKERRYCFTLETTKELQFRKFPIHWKKQILHLFRFEEPRKYLKTWKLCLFPPPLPKALLETSMVMEGNFRLILFDKGLEWNLITKIVSELRIYDGGVAIQERKIRGSEIKMCLRMSSNMFFFFDLNLILFCFKLFF